MKLWQTLADIESIESCRARAGLHPWACALAERGLVLGSDASDASDALCD